MTKSQLVARLADDSAGLSRKQVDELVNGLVDTIVKNVKKGESVKIPARKKVGFSVAKTFKESVLGKAK